MYKPNGCYIDLNVPLPITAEELFDEDDNKFINCTTPDQHDIFSKPFNTTNMFWSIPPGGPSPDGTIGFITNPEIVQTLKDYYNTHFAIDVLGDHHGDYPEPFSIVKFHKTSQYHREGLNTIHTEAYKSTEEYKSTFTGRFPYCINFRLVGKPDDSAVHFGEPSDKLVQEEQFLENKLLNSIKNKLESGYDLAQSTTGRRLQAKSKKYDLGVFRARTGFYSGRDEQELLTTKVVRSGNYCPFIINVAEWHKVIVPALPDGNARVTLRFMGSECYTFNELEELHKNKKLLVQTQ
jgi:hypothetical protein|tara:strand:- start:1 stop:879 length:879 start_codon:yes stop_codon:yes gene_type:complete